MKRHVVYFLLTLVSVLALGGCKSSRLVPQGSYMLDKVKVHIADSTKEVSREEMANYIRQQPNHKMLWSVKFRLGIYNMSGRDTTRWWNRWIRRIGEPPVVYDRNLTQASVSQLQKALVNKGYLSARVLVDTAVDTSDRKVRVDYRLYPGPRHFIDSITYDISDPDIGRMILSDSARMPVRKGDPLDLAMLESQREIVTSRLRNRGYFAFSKEYVKFNADTVGDSLGTWLTMKVDIPDSQRVTRDTLPGAHSSYIVRNIIYITDYVPGQEGEILFQRNDSNTVVYKDIQIRYGSRRYLRPSVLYDNCFIRAGKPYSERSVSRTYQALSRMSILKFINIRFVQAGHTGDVGLVDAYIMLTPGKSQTASIELEGTNSEGDLGVAVAMGYSHRNVGKGSETLSAKVRGAYESIGGNLDGLLHNRYMEYSVDLGVNFPKFKAPFLKESFKRRINAATEFKISLNYQERPEYTRIISTAGWSYRWTERGSRNRHTYTPVDINYVYLPESTNDFLNQIAPDNPLLRYSYEDHFIMRMGYSFYHTNKRAEHPWRREMQSNVYTVRVNAEIAGNLLFAINSIFTHRRDFRDHPYKIFGIRYSQYFKAEGDFAFLHTFDHRTSLAFHAGFGIGVPYGNSAVLPFEKRFYGGGANGVRGWDVRTLGPGSYPGTNSVGDFINQCGDIRLDLSVEYRAKLFWVIELGAFIDAGNIWTIHNYPNQPGGMFGFKTFYKEIAAAYGLGLRLDFNYFLLRFDLGMKAHNPARGAERWPIIHPSWGRDSSFHFSIGYPF